MINNLSKHFTEKLLSNGSISADKQELYVYGFFMLLSQLMFLIFACILGLILGCIIESIIFYIAFQFIRRYAGGYHASTETRCEIITTLSITACIVVIKFSRTYDFQTVLMIIALISAVCILFLCPLDTPEKPLTDKEYKYFRRISWLILLIISGVIIVSYIYKAKWLFVPSCLSLILESVLLVAGRIKKDFIAKELSHE